MANRNYNISGEIEPRVPRHPTAALTEALPAVPEVSLAFDGPQQRIYYSNEARPSTVPTSYAKWKQQVPQKSMDSPGVIQKVSRSPSSSATPRKQKTALAITEKPQTPGANVFTKDSRLKFYQKMNPESSQANPKVLSASNSSNPMKSSARRSQMLLPAAPRPQESSDLEKVEVSSPQRREKNTCDCHSHQSENTEIINKLLSLVQSQNAQIQMLQGQVETLLSMRTERPRELNDYQRLPLPAHNPSTNPIDPGLQNPRLQYPKTSREVQEFEEKRDDNCKQLIKEKKVSIGVMTSFELTVQDSVVYNVDAPAATDYQDKSPHPVAIKNLNSRGNPPIGKIPTGPLEQIIEDSESHLSSTVQASNNFHTYSSARKSLQGNPQGDSLACVELPQANPQTNPRINPQSPALPQNQVHRLTDRPPESLKVTPRYSTGENRSPNPGKYSPAAGAVALSNPRGDPPPGDVEPVKKTPQVGWTLYDNVMCQVNEILHNTQEEEKKEMVQEANGSKIVLNGIQQSTLEKLKLFGFTFTDTSGCSEGKSLVDGRRMNPIPIDASYYPRLDYQANVIQTSGSASDTSLHMKALAMKYLGSKQNVSSHQRGMELFTSVVLSNIQNNIPGASISEVPKMDSPRLQASPKALDYQRDNYLIQSKQSPHAPHNPHNILDISSLKRQPKLL